MYNKLISSVDLVFIAFITCGKAQKAKQIAPKNPIIVNKIIYSNVKGKPYEKDDDIKTILKNHIRTSVLFENIINDMLEKGVDTFVEVGPGKTLRGFVKKINRNVNLLNVENMDSLKNTVESFKEL